MFHWVVKLSLRWCVWSFRGKCHPDNCSSWSGLGCAYLSQTTSPILSHLGCPFKRPCLVIEFCCLGWSRVRLCVSSWCAWKEHVSLRGPGRAWEGWMTRLFSPIFLRMVKCGRAEWRLQISWTERRERKVQEALGGRQVRRDMLLEFPSWRNC